MAIGKPAGSPFLLSLESLLAMEITIHGMSHEGDGVHVGPTQAGLPDAERARDAFGAVRVGPPRVDPRHTGDTDTQENPGNGPPKDALSPHGSERRLFSCRVGIVSSHDGDSWTVLNFNSCVRLRSSSMNMLGL